MLFSDDCIRNDKTTHRQDYFCFPTPQIVSPGRQIEEGNQSVFAGGERGVLNLRRRVFFLHHKEIIF